MNVEDNFLDQQKVLIVDDQSTTRILCRRYLKNYSFDVVEAENGYTGIAQFKSELPDIILLDVNMPDIDGFHVCREIRAMPNGRNIPILMMTGLDDTASINKAFEVGATDFITKPINWIIVGHRLRYMLRAKHILVQLSESETRLGDAQRLAHVGNWEWDVDNDKMYWSDELYRIFGLEPKSIDTDYDYLLSRIVPADQSALVNAINLLIAGKKESASIEHRIKVAEEERIVAQQIEINKSRSTKSKLLTATVQDVTRQRRSEEKMRMMALYDNLTGLPNRRYFNEILQRSLDYASKNRSMFALMFVDLDRFKQINDSLGHALGDKFLTIVSERINNAVRHSSSAPRDENHELQDGVVGRFGGDEFTVLMQNMRSSVDVAKVAKRIMEAVSAPINIDGHELFASISIGISFYPTDGRDADTLMKNADISMYHAKSRGRNNYEFYSEAMNVRVLERFNLEYSLQNALEREEFTVYYQPKIDLQSSRVSGVEALLRWVHPDLGLILPNEFISLSEETGLIVPLGKWLLNQTCKQIRDWQDQQLDLAHVAVNLSAKEFLQKDLIDNFKRAVEEYDINPGLLEIEVTESIFMEDTEETCKKMSKLKDIGFTIALDDFGTGYSSLGYLKRLPIDNLKVDRVFIKDVDTNNDSQTIIKTVIAMAECLGLKVTAEGIETEQQLEITKQLGVHEVQGYYYSLPIDASTTARYVESFNAKANLSLIGESKIERDSE